MMIVDNALRVREVEGRPIRVGMIGAGAMGRAISYQIEQCTPGMKVVAICNRTISSAEKAFLDAGAKDARCASSRTALRSSSRSTADLSDHPTALPEFQNEVQHPSTGVIPVG